MYIQACLLITFSVIYYPQRTNIEAYTERDILSQSPQAIFDPYNEDSQRGIFLVYSGAPLPWIITVNNFERSFYSDSTNSVA